MGQTSANDRLSASSTSNQSWQALADQVLGGSPLSESQALGVVESPDDQLLELLAATFRVRQHYFGRRVQLYFLMNAKSGLCGEDCHYCSQSRLSTAQIPKYNLLNRSELIEGARIAVGTLEKDPDRQGEKLPELLAVEDLPCAENALDDPCVDRGLG